MGGWPSGVFWTIATPLETVSADAGKGVARYRVSNLKIPDYRSGLNALANGPTSPGEVSFDVRWFPQRGSKRYRYTHRADDAEPDSYAVDYWSTRATLEWRAKTESATPGQDPFSFRSYKIGRYPKGRSPGQFFAIAGRERNGVFF